MESLRENKPLLIGLLSTASILVVLASGVMPDLSAYMEVVEFPQEVPYVGAVTI